MKKIILAFIIALLTLPAISQEYRKIDWRFEVKDVVLLGRDTFRITATPSSFSDPGAIERNVGNWVVDYVARTFKVIGSTATTLDVVDIEHCNTAPQTGRIARCYSSIVDETELFESIGGLDDTPLDKSSTWKIIARNNEIFGRAIDSVLNSIDTSQWINTTGGIYYPDRVGVGGASTANKFYVRDTSNASVAYFNQLSNDGFGVRIKADSIPDDNYILNVGDDNFRVNGNGDISATNTIKHAPAINYDESATLGQVVSVSDSAIIRNQATTLEALTGLDPSPD